MVKTTIVYTGALTRPARQEAPFESAELLVEPTAESFTLIWSEFQDRLKLGPGSSWLASLQIALNQKKTDIHVGWLDAQKSLTLFDSRRPILPIGEKVRQVGPVRGPARIDFNQTPPIIDGRLWAFQTFGESGRILKRGFSIGRRFQACFNGDQSFIRTLE